MGGNLSLERGWGVPGTRRFLPLSPKHLLSACVGVRPPPLDTTYSLAEAAFFSAYPRLKPPPAILVYQASDTLFMDDDIRAYIAFRVHAPTRMRVVIVVAFERPLVEVLEVGERELNPPAGVTRQHEAISCEMSGGYLGIRSFV